VNRPGKNRDAIRHQGDGVGVKLETFALQRSEDCDHCRALFARTITVFMSFGLFREFTNVVIRTTKRRGMPPSDVR
jgi:hypothetical protein